MRDDSVEQPDAAELVAAHERALSGFAEALGLLHIDCGAPPRSALTKGARAAGRCSLPASSLTEVFQGRRLPKLDFTIELVRQLRPGDPDLLDEWRDRWRDVKRAEHRAASARRALKARPQGGAPAVPTVPHEVEQERERDQDRPASKKDQSKNNSSRRALKNKNKGSRRAEDAPLCPVCRLPTHRDFAEVWACDGCGGISRWDASGTVILMDSSRGRSSSETNAYICTTCDLLVHPLKMQGDLCPRCGTNLVTGERARDDDAVW
ncbi:MULTISPECIES: hypothetical protein [Streptomyces]|uniref:hypothetical protein n=1 Tax=Streptomyces TaxID=1883 RepID=UPI000AA70D43|nr:MULTISPECIES: hypothetical protein [Streptomyces]